MTKLELVAKYGAFRVVRDGVVVFDAETHPGMNEGEATDLAEEVSGSIEHQNPKTGEWKEW